MSFLLEFHEDDPIKLNVYTQRWRSDTWLEHASRTSNMIVPWKVTFNLGPVFVSSSIPSWQISTAHAQPFRGARDLAFCLKVPLDSLLVWASSNGSGETARMRRLAWTFAARIGDMYQIRLVWPILYKASYSKVCQSMHSGLVMLWCHDVTILSRKWQHNFNM